MSMRIRINKIVKHLAPVHPDAPLTLLVKAPTEPDNPDDPCIMYYHCVYVTCKPLYYPCEEPC